MSTPVIPDGWQDDGTTLTAPDTSTSTGQTRDQIITVFPTQIAGLQTTITQLQQQVNGTPVTQAQLAAVQAQLDALTAQVNALPVDDDSAEDDRLTKLEAGFAAIVAELQKLGSDISADLSAFTGA